jgi:hypothetical protein
MRTPLRPDIQRPEVTFAKAAARYAIPTYRNVGGALERVPGAAHVLTELLRRQIPDGAVEVAFAGDLVTTASDLGDHLGLVFADPSEDGECRFCIDLVEKIEGKFSVPVHAAFETVPIIGRYDPAHRADMTVVFENNAQQMPAG